jgi:hypothetical protein
VKVNGEIEQIGLGFTIKVAVHVEVQPKLSVTVKQYGPASAACALLMISVVPVDRQSPVPGQAPFFQQ